MPRKFTTTDFNKIYNEFIKKGTLNEVQTYYSVFRYRYFTLIKRFCELVDEKPQDVLDIGGGQYALLCKKIWNDKVTLADINTTNFDYLQSNGVQTVKWNLSSSEFPIEKKYDVIFFSEVIEHLPIPGHIALERLKKVLKNGGHIICTTPNLYRIRNVIFLALGKPIFDYFRFSGDSMGHMLEYSKEHLLWQFEQAGFKHISVEILQLHRSRTSILHKVLAILGAPLYIIIRRFRDNLLAIAKNSD